MPPATSSSSRWRAVSRRRRVAAWWRGSAAQKRADLLSQEFQIDGKSVRTGVTTGISVFPHNGADAASLLANSNAALFRAKAKSRGSISIYEPEMDQQRRHRRVLHQGR